MIIEVLPAPRKPVNTVIGMAAITETDNNLTTRKSMEGRHSLLTSHTFYTVSATDPTGHSNATSLLAIPVILISLSLRLALLFEILAALHDILLSF